MHALMEWTWHRLIGRTALGLVAFLFIGSRPAAASMEYPALVESYWGVRKLPVTGADGCPLCHTTDPGMAGTANQKFATTLKSFGLLPLNDDLLKAALDKNKSKMADSDGDGVSDYEEIVVYDTNPNSADDHPTLMPMGSGGSGMANSSAGGSSSNLEAGATAEDQGGADGSTDMNASGSVVECTPTRQMYPTLGHGCSFRAGRVSSSRILFAFAGILAACLIRRGVRARKGRRETSGKQVEPNAFALRQSAGFGIGAICFVVSAKPRWREPTRSVASHRRRQLGIALTSE